MTWDTWDHDRVARYEKRHGELTLKEKFWIAGGWMPATQQYD
jgi:hypothetical protein